MREWRCNIVVYMVVNIFREGGDWWLKIEGMDKEIMKVVSERLEGDERRYLELLVENGGRWRLEDEDGVKMKDVCVFWR